MFVVVHGIVLVVPRLIEVSSVHIARRKVASLLIIRSGSNLCMYDTGTDEM